MPTQTATNRSLREFFFNFTFIIAALYGMTGLITACGSNTTIVFQNPSDGEEDDDGGDAISAKSPNSMGTPVIYSHSQHMDLLLSGGNAIPIIYSRTQSGSVEISSDMDF